MAEYAAELNIAGMALEEKMELDDAQLAPYELYQDQCAIPRPVRYYQPAQEEAILAAQAAARMHEHQTRTNAIVSRAPEPDRKEPAPQGPAPSPIDLESIPGYEPMPAAAQPAPSTVSLSKIDAAQAKILAQFPDQSFAEEDIKERNIDRAKHARDLADNKRKAHELQIRGKHLERLLLADANMTSLRKERKFVRGITAPREVKEEKRVNRVKAMHTRNQAWLEAEAAQMREQQEAMWSQQRHTKKARVVEDEGKHD